MAKGIGHHTKTFGAFEARSANNIYQAETDGIVVVRGLGCDSGQYIRVTMGWVNPPVQLIVNQTSGSANASISLTVPIKKGMYYGITFTGTSIDGLWTPVK